MCVMRCSLYLIDRDRCVWTCSLATLASVRTSMWTCIRYLNQHMYAMYGYEQHLSSMFVNTTTRYENRQNEVPKCKTVLTLKKDYKGKRIKPWSFHQPIFQYMQHLNLPNTKDELLQFFYGHADFRWKILFQKYFQSQVHQVV
jgi:hypothetical protein